MEYRRLVLILLLCKIGSWQWISGVSDMAVEIIGDEFEDYFTEYKIQGTVFSIVTGII